MKKQYSVLLLLLILAVLNSCVSKRKLTYLQYSDKNFVHGTDIQSSATPAAYRIMPYDNLYIRVVTPDPQWSELFNVMPVGSGGAVTEESASLFGYPVDSNGKIEIPFVGKVDAGGKTLSELKTELDSIFRNYVADAAITIRLVNNYISILGEVNAPGRYHLTKDRVNIFEAISMAADMSEYSNRLRVMLIRPTPYGPTIKEFSLLDRSILSSEFYYLMPNDIIYAMPLQGRSFQANSPAWTLLLTTVTSALGMIAFFRTL